MKSENIKIRTDNMPAEMRSLLCDYPRDTWPAHPGFKDKTRQWLGAHQMFRRLSGIVREDIESYLTGNSDAQDYSARLSYLGGRLVGNLHGHHSWEDHSYFPELSAADARFDAGFLILEKDHIALNQALDRFVAIGNRAINLIQVGDKLAREKVARLHVVAETIETLLQRHLGDEEDLAVPIILHYRLRG